MKISIIIPVYNDKKYLSRCVDALINQSNSNLEILLVDDGSTDGSAHQCDYYALHFKNIRAIHKNNGGVSSARNVGLKHVSGQYVYFMDSDDWVEPDYFEKCTKELLKNKVDILVTPYIREYNGKSVRSKLFDRAGEIVTGTKKNQIYLRRLIGLTGDELGHPARIENLNAVWGKFYKANILNKIEFLDVQEIWAEDLWFNINAFYESLSCEYFNDVYYHYYKDNDSSLTKNVKNNILGQYKKLYKIISSFIDEKELGEEYKEALSNRIILNLITVALNYSNDYYQLRSTLSDDIYKDTFKSFSFKKLPFPYKIFFFMCKRKWCFALMISVRLIKKIQYVKE